MEHLKPSSDKSKDFSVANPLENQLPKNERKILYEQLGLKKEMVGDIPLYILEFTEEYPSTDIIQNLKAKLKNRRIATEIGPGNQLSSLLFAAKKSNSDVVIGIDPQFDINNFSQITIEKTEKIPDIIFLKGDGWGDVRINRDLFNTSSEDAKDRLAIYSQLVAPDAFSTERMIYSTLCKTRGLSYRVRFRLR